MDAFLYDSHAHLTCESLNPQAERLVQEAVEAGVKRMMVIATDAPSLQHGLSLKKHFPWTICLAAATTPHDVSEEGESFFNQVTQVAKQGELSAIGETGLDCYNAQTPLELQEVWTVKYLRLARDVNLPVVLHCRNAFEPLLKLLDEEYRDQDGGYGKAGVLHCFTGTLQEAKEMLARGFFISLSGILTYKNSHELRAIVKQLPLSKLLLETDSPYLAPQGMRGKVNAPAYMVETALCLAQLHEVPFEHVQRVTTANAVRLFGG